MVFLTKPMTLNELSDLVDELAKARKRETAIKSKIERFRNTLKQHMTLKGIDSMDVNGWTIRWTNVTRQILDTEALKNELPQIAAAYTKEAETKRFEVVKRA